MGRIRPHRQLPWTALLALIAGIGFYFLARDHSTVYFLTLLPQPLQLDDPLSCTACDALPSFLHVYAFILLSAYVLQPTTRKQLASLCLVWSGIEALFEIGQIDRVAILINDQLIAGGEVHPLLSLTGDYLLHGTFDPMDLMFIGLGASAAYLFLSYAAASEVNHENAEHHKYSSV